MKLSLARLVTRVLHLVLLCALFVVVGTFGATPSASAAMTGAHQTLSTGFVYQFTSGGHLLGFRNDGVYIVSVAQALRIEFVDANRVEPQSSTPSTANGKVNPLGTVSWRDVWDGISVSYQAAEGGIAESVYTLGPGARVDRIRWRYNAPANLNADGSLTLSLANGQMNESAPRAWQEIEGQRISIPVEFHMRGATSSPEEQWSEIGFTLGAYDPRYPLTIDPVLAWVRFFGTEGRERTQDIALDSSGNIYVTGWSDGTWGDPLHAYTDYDDAFVAKFNGATGAIMWNTFLGGAGSDSGNGIAIYNDTYIYVAGDSSDTWGTPLNPFTTGTMPEDIFMAKLDLSGNLLWNTFLGGTGREAPSGVAVDSSGNVYLSGSGSATWGTPKRAFSGYYAAFVAKLNSSGTVLWNTFLGGAGSSGSYAYDITVDGGNAYVVGDSSATWGTPVRPFSGSYDVFAAKLDTSGNLVWNTFLGDMESDYSHGGIALDGSGNVFVAGYSYTTWGSPQQGFMGNEANGFIAKLNQTNGNLVWNSFVGGNGTDAIWNITVDGSGNAFATGSSEATWGSPVRPFTSGIGYFDQDAFVAKLNSAGYLQWNTFLGGTDDDTGTALVLGASGQVFMTGGSWFTWGTPVHAHSGGEDAMITKLNASNGVLQWNTFEGTAGNDTGTAIAVDASGNVYFTGLTTGNSWSLGNTLPDLRPSSGGQEAFLGKMNSAGMWQWQTFWGGTGSDSGSAIAIDATGHVYVAGYSNVSWGTAPARAFTGGYDGFIARVDASTGVLQWNTFLGGSGTDYVTGIGVDSSGNTYVSGESTATWGSPVRTFGTGWGAFAAKVGSTGALVWNTFLGGSGNDEGNAITLQYTLLYVTGNSTASWGSPLRSYLGGTDAFVAQLNAITGDLMWNTFLGGPGNDYGKAITTDSSGGLYVAGSSDANWGPIPERAYNAGIDTFVSKLNALGTLQWNTFLGGSGTDDGRGIAADNGHIYVIGVSDASWGTPAMAYSSGMDGYVAALDPNGGLWWNRFVGGVRTDYGNAIAAAADGQLHLTGSSNYPWGMYSYPTGGYDVFVAKMDGRGQLYLPMIRR